VAGTAEAGTAKRYSSTGNYRVWVRMQGPSSSSDSVRVGLDGGDATGGAGFGMSNQSSSWSWIDDVVNGPSNVTVNIPSPGDYTFTVYMREDGIKVDKIVLNKSGSKPSGNGPAESPQN